MTSFSPTRCALILLSMGLTLLALTGRVVWLQTIGREQTVQQAERQQHLRQSMSARRGSVFDSHGMLLAGTVQSRTLFADPKFLLDAYKKPDMGMIKLDKDMEILGRLIERNGFEISKQISDRAFARFVKLAEGIDDPTAQRIAELKIPGLGFVAASNRYYPMGSIAAHVLGGTQKDGPGLEGVEKQFDRVLSGQDGAKRSLKDARRRVISVAAHDYTEPTHGQHLILTIDSSIQMIAEQELAATCDKWRANRGEAIVMDPSTGAILAMANWPAFNPQNLSDSHPEMRRNRCITDPYEPGSTIKPFIMGPAISARVTRVSEVWPVGGASYKSSLRSKIVTDVHGYGPLSTWDILVKSSNIGMTMLGERWGAKGVRGALASFGFGQKTGLELAGEDPGLLNPIRQWKNIDIVSAVQGYSLMVTPLQLARGFCVFANGGRLVEPHIVKGILESNGTVVELQAPKDLSLRPQVLDPQTTVALKRVLSDVPVRGTARSARSHVWNIFGKTGTAHVAKNGSYNETSYTSSFLCGAPAENPKLVVAMIIHEPDKQHAVSQGYMYYGGTIAAPGAKEVVERTLAYLQVPASPQLQPPPPQIEDILVNYDPRVYTAKAVVAQTD